MESAATVAAMKNRLDILVPLFVRANVFIYIHYNGI